MFNNILHKCGLQCEGASAEPQKLEERVNVTPGNMPLQVEPLLCALCCLSSCKLNGPCSTETTDGHSVPRQLIQHMSLFHCLAFDLMIKPFQHEFLALLLCISSTSTVSCILQSRRRFNLNLMHPWQSGLCCVLRKARVVFFSR